jgi:hypothetical protein
MGVDLRGEYLLVRLARNELPEMLRRLHEEWPEAFVFCENPPRVQRTLYRAYTRLRSEFDAAARLATSLDRYLWPALFTAAPVVLVLDGLVAVRRRLRLKRARGTECDRREFTSVDALPARGA